MPVLLSLQSYLFYSHAWTDELNTIIRRFQDERVARAAAAAAAATTAAAVGVAAAAAASVAPLSPLERAVVAAVDEAAVPAIEARLRATRPANSK